MKEIFNDQSTLGVLQANRRVQEVLPDQIKVLLPELDQQMTLAEWQASGTAPFDAQSLQQFLWLANIFASLDQEGDEDSVLLWEDPPLFVPGSMGRPYLDLYLLDHQAPLVVVVPGGGYHMTAIEHEGRQIAEAYNAAGFHAVMLRYRVKPNPFRASLIDLIATIKRVRAHADEWRVESNHIAVCGFSAGGHLSASLGGLYDQIPVPADQYPDISARPNALILSYAVINFASFKEPGVADLLFGEDTDEVLHKALACDEMVDANYPPSFIWTCGIDETVPIENSQWMASACERAGVAHELRIYPGGAHGVGLGKGLEAEKWLDESTAFLKKIFQTPA